MSELTTFYEDFHLGLLPRVVQEADSNGYVRALLGGWQDRQEELRSVIDQFTTFVDPMSDQAPTTNVIVVTFTSQNGAAVQRRLHINEHFRAAVALLESPPSDVTTYAAQLGLETTATFEQVMCAWAEQLLHLDQGQVTSVALGYSSAMALPVATIGLLAQTLGGQAWPQGLTSESLKRVARDQLAWVRTKGTRRSLLHRLYAVGFTEAMCLPLWSRLSPRVGDAADSSDFAANPDTEPTQADYDVSSFRDGPFHLWEQPCSLFDFSTFYTAVNQGSPFIRVKLHGLSELNHRREWTTHSRYLQGDVVTHLSRAYVAKTFPSGEPGTTGAVGWTRVYPPVVGSYFLAGGADNVKATAIVAGVDEDDPDNPTTVTESGLVVEAISAGADFDGLEVVISDWVTLATTALPSVAAFQRVSLGTWLEGEYRLTYLTGHWQSQAGTGHYRVTRGPTADPGYHITVYSGSTPNYFAEPEPTNEYASAEDAALVCRDLAVTFSHAGGDEVAFTFSAASYTNNVNGRVPLTFKLERQETEMRTLRVYDRLSRVKYRSSHFDVVVTQATVADQPVQPNSVLLTNPAAAWPHVAVSPYRPFSGDGSIPASANARQLDESALALPTALVAATVEEWRPATRLPRQVSVGVAIQDEFRVSPYTLDVVLFTTDGSTSHSGSATTPWPRAFPAISSS